MMKILIIILVCAWYIVRAVVAQTRRSNDKDISTTAQTDESADEYEVYEATYDRVSSESYRPEKNIKKENKNTTSRRPAAPISSTEAAIEQNVSDVEDVNLLPDFTDQEQVRNAIISAEILNRKYT